MPVDKLKVGDSVTMGFLRKEIFRPKKIYKVTAIYKKFLKVEGGEKYCVDTHRPYPRVDFNDVCIRRTLPEHIRDLKQAKDDSDNTRAAQAKQDQLRDEFFKKVESLKERLLCDLDPNWIEVEVNFLNEMIETILTREWEPPKEK